MDGWMDGFGVKGSLSFKNKNKNKIKATTSS
jgi:hypothetical protein